MNTDPLGNRAAESSATGRIDSTGLPPSTAATGVMGVPAVEVDVADVPMRDRIRWGPIIAGVVTAFAVLLFLTVLGIALGISALGGDNDNNPQTWGTAAGIWGGLSLLVAFFFGGWMAARAAATLSESDGPLNGFVTGAATLLLLLWLATTALTGALGFFASTVSNLAGAAAPVAMRGCRPRRCSPSRRRPRSIRPLENPGGRGSDGSRSKRRNRPAERHPRPLVQAHGVRRSPSFSPSARRRWAEWLAATNGW